MKKQVDEIVNQMARLSSVQKCYEKWLELQHEVNEFYSDKPMERAPLSQRKKFRVIHNVIIQAALRLEQLTFEDKGMERYDEPDAQYAFGKLLLSDDVEVHDREQGIRWLTQAAEGGHEFAAYRLAKELLKSGKVKEALPWLTKSAEDDNPYAEYLLGKLYWEGEDIPQDMGQAIYWLTKAVEQGHTHAQILLGRHDHEVTEKRPPAKRGPLESYIVIFGV